MMPWNMPLLAAGPEWVVIVFVLISFISWLLQQFNNPKQPVEPPVRRPGRPPQPRDGRVQDEIEVFIQEVNQPRRIKPDLSQVPPQQRRRKRPERAVSSEAPPAPPLSERQPRRPVAEQFGDGLRSQIAESHQLSTVASQHLASRVSAGVTAHLGRVTAASPAPDPRRHAEAAGRLRTVFRNASAVKQAIVIQEVLSPPKALRK